ncbi:MAG: hypothetical protein P1U52_01090 [Porticoccaceae bacterium]|nr:hypothetical protein [Porticoccaceae bacterium]
MPNQNQHANHSALLGKIIKVVVQSALEKQKVQHAMEQGFFKANTGSIASI